MKRLEDLTTEAGLQQKAEVVDQVQQALEREEMKGLNKLLTEISQIKKPALKRAGSLSYLLLRLRLRRKVGISNVSLDSSVLVPNLDGSG